MWGLSGGSLGTGGTSTTHPLNPAPPQTFLIPLHSISPLLIVTGSLPVLVLYLPEVSLTF